MPRTRRRKANTACPTAYEAFIYDGADDAEHDLPLSDEEETTRTKDKLKILAYYGQLGLSNPTEGFNPRTHFTMEVHGDIFSVDYQLKGININGRSHHNGTHNAGSVFNVKLDHEVLACFVPARCLFVPERFKVRYNNLIVQDQFSLTSNNFS